MRIKPSEQDLVFYHPSTTRWNKQDQPLRGDLVFYHLGTPGPLKAERSLAFSPGFDVISVMVFEIVRVLLAPPLLGLSLAGSPAKISPTGLLPRPNSGIGTEELTAKQALLPQG